MSQENVDLIRRAFDAYERGDMDGILAMCAEDVVVVQAPAIVATGVPAEQYGHAGVLEAFRLWPEQWEDFEIEIARVVAHPGEYVVLSTWQRGRGRQSGVAVEAEFFFTHRIRDGLIDEWRIFTEENEALAAARPSGPLTC